MQVNVNEGVRLESLSNGDCFAYSGNFYIFTNFRTPCNGKTVRGAVDLETGIMAYFDPNEVVVKPLNAEITVK